MKMQKWFWEKEEDRRRVVNKMYLEKIIIKNEK